MEPMIYLGLFVLSVLCIKLYLPLFAKQHGIHYMSYMILAAVSVLNYYFLSSAQSAETALTAQKNIYAVMLFFPMIFLSILCDLCRTPRRLVQEFITVISFMLIMVIITTEKTGLFYREYNLDPVTREITKVYGPFHGVYMLYLAVVFLMTFTVIHSARHKTDIPMSAVSEVVAMELIMILSIYLGNILHIGFSFDAVGMLIIDGMMLVLTRRLPLYDVNASVVERIDYDGAMGVIIADRKQRLLGYNGNLKEMLPEIAESRLDEKLPESFPYKAMFEQMAAEYEQRGSVIRRELSIGEKWYSFELFSLKYHGKHSGYQMLVRDVTEEERYIHLLETYREELLQEVDSKVSQIDRMQDAILLGIAEMIESRDGSTGGHIKRTSHVVSILTKELMGSGTFDVPPVFYAVITKAAPLHDIGKIAVDDAILRKPGRFTPEEFAQMKEHAASGGRILRKIMKGIENKEWTDIAVNIAAHHHERWDGNGYPDRLAGEDIPLEARIMAVADVYDALVSKRCYKEEFDFGKARSIILEGMGTQFDPHLKDCFCACLPALEEYYTALRQDGGNA